MQTVMKKEKKEKSKNTIGFEKRIGKEKQYKIIREEDHLEIEWLYRHY